MWYSSAQPCRLGVPCVGLHLASRRFRACADAAWRASGCAARDHRHPRGSQAGPGEARQGAASPGPSPPYSVAARSSSVSMLASQVSAEALHQGTTACYSCCVHGCTWICWLCCSRMAQPSMIHPCLVAWLKLGHAATECKHSRVRSCTQGDHLDLGPLSVHTDFESSSLRRCKRTSSPGAMVTKGVLH